MPQAMPVRWGRLLWWAAAVAVGAAFLLTVAGGYRVVQVHDTYGTWALLPGPRTPKIPVNGRNYIRGNALGSVPVEATVRWGTAPGRGEVFSSPPVSGATPTVLYVRYRDGTVTDYSLSGGP